MASGGDERAIEVNAFDERVDGEDLEPVALRLDDRRIVADADQRASRRCGRQLLLDAGDRARASVQVGDGGKAEQARSYFA